MIEVHEINEPNSIIYNHGQFAIYLNSAPEVIDEHEYSRQCDIWSIGVILFTL
jgi:hypothetical protein